MEPWLRSVSHVAVVWSCHYQKRVCERGNFYSKYVGVGFFIVSDTFVL